MNRPVEREFPDQHEIRDITTLDYALGRQDTQGNREIEGRPGFPHAGGREVHRDAMGGELEAGVADGAANAVPALANAGIGQSDHGENGQPEGDVHLDEDGAGVDAEDSSRPETSEHREASLQTTR